MTLTTRLLLFFLLGLGVVLAGFSTGLFLLARDHLYRRAEERLTAADRTLAAAAEVGPDGVEWEPAGRILNLGRHGDAVLWRVNDEAGRALDQSGPAAELLAAPDDAAGRLHDP